jgi:UDP:flavonoid glycosyltransferase YjiC (YdhE family)
MRVFLLTLGTRGDFELFFCLGCELRRRGHSVLLGSSGFYADRVAAAGLTWAPMGDGRHEDLLALLRSLSNVEDKVQRVRQVADQWLRPQLAAAQAQISRAGLMSDYFVSNLKLMLKRAGAILPGAFVSYDPPSAIEDLARYSGAEQDGRIIELVAMSKGLIDPDERWGSEFRFTGFWRSEDAGNWTPPEALSTFVERGAPPVVMTMGSMVTLSLETLLGSLAEALRLCRRRGVVVGGWAGAPAAADESVMTVQEADYEWLFPRAACVIHHGGSGTVGAALRAGRPSVLLPQIPAQEAFGRLLMRAGLASASLETHDLAPRELAAAIERAATDPVLNENARRWRDVVCAEGGVTAAADLIEQHWSQINSKAGVER